MGHCLLTPMSTMVLKPLRVARTTIDLLLGILPKPLLSYLDDCIFPEDCVVYHMFSPRGWQTKLVQQLSQEQFMANYTALHPLALN